MKTSFTSTCRHCRHYTPEGRRGGVCQQLSVPVQSGWTACSLAIPPFAPSWEEMEELVLSQQAELLQNVIPVQTPEFNTCETSWSVFSEISA